MQITIAAVGKRIPDWTKTGFQEYQKRLSGEINLSLIEIPPGRHSKNSGKTRLLLDEAASIRSALPRNNYLIVMDERGESQTTHKLSEQMANWMQDGINVCFIIGGAEGLDKSVIDLADERWSLSAYTLPHAFVRVLLAEQLYRAWSILRNHPYHRE